MVLDSIKNTALQAAYDAGKILKSHFGNLTRVDKKGVIDLVTAADLAAEKSIVTCIKHTFPQHQIIAEESGLLKSDSRHKWIVDPLDGTTNFVHNLPIFAVSIAHSVDDKIDLGVVFNPMSDELFYAEIYCGATLNQQKITVSSVMELENALLVTGFPYNLRDDASGLIARFKRCLTASQGIRRLGAAALDLCYIGCGRFDGFWEQGLKPWDTAAGTLIASEAGARITDFSSLSFQIDHPEIVATNNHIHDELVRILNDRKPNER